MPGILNINWLQRCRAWLRGGMELTRAAFALRHLTAISLCLWSGAALADPVSAAPRFTFAGNMDFVVTGGSLRTQPNSGNSCAVTNSDSAPLSGIPIGASIVAAYLYWAGSGPATDPDVTFQGLPLTASRTFSDNYSLPGLSLDFFSGFADVTSRVTGNGTYTFADLDVTNTDIGGDGDYCSRSAVLSGWGLVVVYEAVTEPLRVINLFDGFQPFRGGQIVLNPTNFVIPAAPIDGQIGILSWEGDTENSDPLGGATESVEFDGQSTAPVDLIDGLNPTNNQFNSTVNATGSVSEYGVDFDVYDLSSYLTAGDNNAQTTYESGGDLVLLSLEIISVTNTPAADLSLGKSHAGDFVAGTTGQFDLSVSNLGPSDNAGPITLTDTLAAGLTYQSFASADPAWSCAAVAQTVTCNHAGPLLQSAVLAPVTLNVAVDASLAPSVSNTATVTSATFDPILGNNSATDVANVLLADLSTSTKAVVDINGLPTLPGDTLRYTIAVTESAGVDVIGASVNDTLSSLLTNLIVVDAAGGTDSSTASVVQISDVNVPGGTTVNIVFEADVVGSASNGDVIANTADITNPTDATVSTVSSPDVTVGSSAPASGIKFLYFRDIAGTTNSPTLPLEMSRVPLGVASNPVRVRIRRQDNDRVWALTPALQAPLTLDGSGMPLRLQLQRNNNASNRDVQVTLAYNTGGADTFVGCDRQTLSATGVNGLSNATTREFVFTINQTDASCSTLSTAPLTIPQGAELTVWVDNEPAVGPGGQAIFVYPFDTATSRPSQLELPATTVINVDSTQFIDGGGAVVGTAFVGDTVRIRSVVSDPFGSFDIGSVTYRLLDPVGTVVQSGTLPQTADSGVASATYEIAFVIPAAGPVGDWTAEITANEGTEGTVSHTAIGTLQVAENAVVLDKTMRVVFDAVTGTNNPKSIPGAQVEYTISVINQGGSILSNDSVVIADLLPTQLRLFFGAPVVNPFVFTDGATSSALTFAFVNLADAGDDVRFSNDGGTSFIVPSVDLLGYDATTPRINYVEFAPKGSMAADTGTGSPSFNITFEARLQ